MVQKKKRCRCGKCDWCKTNRKLINARHRAAKKKKEADKRAERRVVQAVRRREGRELEACARQLQQAKVAKQKAEAAARRKAAEANKHKYGDANEPLAKQASSKRCWTCGMQAWP
jgi:hypothetical protein